MPLIAFSTATSLLPQSHFRPLLACLHLHQRRTAMRDFFKNPFKSRARHKIIDSSSNTEIREALEARKARTAEERTKPPETGDLAPGSIIDDLSPKVKPSKDSSGVPDTKYKKKSLIRNPYRMAAVLDPMPGARARWQRKMVIREIRARGRMTKTVKLARTERSHLSKSELIKTSVKKLFPLANQIAGKPLSEAMVQMRFSKKKAAQDVLKHLEYARDQAIVMRGMGLGKVQVAAETQEAEEEEEERLVVEDKKGKKRVVTDRTAMYVDEAWVGRGSYGFGVEFRAKGKVNRLNLPTTSKSNLPTFLALALVIRCFGRMWTLNLILRHFRRAEGRGYEDTAGAG